MTRTPFGANWHQAKKSIKGPDSRGAWLIAVIIALALALFFLDSRGLPDSIERWPRWLAAVGGGLLLGYFAQQALAVLRERSRGELWDLEEIERDALEYGNAEDYSQGGDHRTAIAFSWFAFLGLAGWAFGWLVAIALFVPLYLFAFGERRVWVFSVLTFFLLSTLYLLFDAVLLVNFTRGAVYSPDWLLQWVRT